MNVNCANCGAGLALPEYQDLLLCAYCKTVHTPSLRHDGLIKRIDGARSAKTCPLCSQGLSHAEIENWQFLYCGDCHGLLIDGDHLPEIIIYCRHDNKNPRRDPEPIKKSDLQRTIACPFCAEAMATHEYYGPGDFVIDSCRSCKRVWLDAGELAKSADVKWGGSLWG